MNKERFRIPEEAVIEVLLSRLDQRPLTRRVRSREDLVPTRPRYRRSAMRSRPAKRIPVDVIGLIAHPSGCGSRGPVGRQRARMSSFRTSISSWPVPGAASFIAFQTRVPVLSARSTPTAIGRAQKDAPLDLNAETQPRPSSSHCSTFRATMTSSMTFRTTAATWSSTRAARSNALLARVAQRDVAPMKDMGRCGSLDHTCLVPCLRRGTVPAFRSRP